MRAGSSRFASVSLWHRACHVSASQVPGTVLSVSCVLIQCPAWEVVCPFRNEKNGALQDSVTCPRCCSGRRRRQDSDRGSPGIRSVLSSPSPLYRPFHLESYGGLLTDPPAQQGLQVAWDAGKGTSLASDGPGFDPDSSPDCLYNLEQVLTSQSLSPPLLNGENNVYFIQLWGRINNRDERVWHGAWDMG